MVTNGSSSPMRGDGDGWVALTRDEDIRLSREIAERMLGLPTTQPPTADRSAQELLWDYLLRCGPRERWFAFRCICAAGFAGVPLPYWDHGDPPPEVQDVMQAVFAKLIDLEYMSDLQRDRQRQGKPYRLVVREFYERLLKTLAAYDRGELDLEAPAPTEKPFLYVALNRQILGAVRDHLRKVAPRRERKRVEEGAFPDSEREDVLADQEHREIRRRVRSQFTRLLPHLGAEGRQTPTAPEKRRRRIRSLIGRYFLYLDVEKDLQTLWTSVQDLDPEFAARNAERAANRLKEPQTSVGSEEEANQAARHRTERARNHLRDWARELRLESQPPRQAALIADFYVRPISCALSADREGLAADVSAIARDFDHSNVPKLLREQSAPPWWNGYVSQHGDFDDTRFDAFQLNDRIQSFWPELPPTKKLEPIFLLQRLEERDGEQEEPKPASDSEDATMPHLPAQRLADLVFRGDTPTRDEFAHLAKCAACREALQDGFDSVAAIESALEDPKLRAELEDALVATPPAPEAPAATDPVGSPVCDVSDLLTRSVRIVQSAVVQGLERVTGRIVRPELPDGEAGFAFQAGPRQADSVSDPREAEAALNAWPAADRLLLTLDAERGLLLEFRRPIRSDSSEQAWDLELILARQSDDGTRRPFVGATLTASGPGWRTSGQTRGPGRTCLVGCRCEPFDLHITLPEAEADGCVQYEFQGLDLQRLHARVTST